MITAPRVVVIDDKKEHLHAIVNAFNQLGTSCFGIEYDASKGVDPNLLRGVRVLFLDLHLIDGAKASDKTKHFSNIADILESGISNDGGPYLLIMWTENPEDVLALEAFLEERLFQDQPHTRPVAFDALSKTTVVDVETGNAKSEADLTQKIANLVEASPQFSALLAWERDVLAAAGSTLSTILDLIPPEDRTLERGGPALDEILSLLAREQVGRGNVATDVRSAINSILAPILADRIMNRDPAEGAPQLWETAVTRSGDNDLQRPSSQQSGYINRMLHLSHGDAETLTSSEWGAVVKFPEDIWTDQGIQNRFGVSRGTLLGQEFKIRGASRDAVQPVLVRIGASCDHAQNSAGPTTYLLGLKIPETAKRVMVGNPAELRLSASIWTSPEICLEQNGEVFAIEVNCRYPFVATADEVDNFKILFRLREQLLTHLLHHSGTYSIRPGIVSI